MLVRDSGTAIAQADNRLAPNGALIAGDDVNLITGGDLLNACTLRASNNLVAKAGNDLTNLGLIEAGDRLDLLAGNNLVNKAGGLISGRDVTLSATNGDVINERAVTSFHDLSIPGNERVFDSKGRIEAANDLSFNAGRDVRMVGGDFSSGRDMSITAGRDVLFDSAEHVVDRRANGYRSQTVTQYGAQVTAGRDLSIITGRDFTAIASGLEAKRDISVGVLNDITLASAANEEHTYSKTRKVTRQEDRVRQVGTTLMAGGNVTLNAMNDLALISSRISAGNEAYLYAGNQLSLLAETDSDYSLYEKKSKGSWGKKKTQRDEVTDVRHVGSEITTGGDIMLGSGGDQRYQAAKLTSGDDLTLESGGEIAFEGVKDLKQESHEKSKSSLAWFSMKGKGRTDETLRQSELTAQGDLVINAVGQIHADVRQVNQETVRESIDAMVKADPKLAWLKELEAQGGIDWRQVQEVHTSFKYSNSGMGPAAQIVIAIILAAVAGPAFSGLIGAGATTGTAMAAATTTVTAAGTTTLAAGWANLALTAVATSATTTATVSTINNRGDLGAVFKDVTSKDSLRGYAVAGATAGLTAGVYDKLTGTQTAAGGALPNAGKMVTSAELTTLEGISRFGANQLLQNGTSSVLDRALGGNSTLDTALRSSLANTFAAAGFNLVGDVAFDFGLEEGSLGKIGLHAVMGGLAAEASGGSFKTGALAAGVNEALVDVLAAQYIKMPEEQKQRLLVMSSQLVGVFTAAATSSDPADLRTASWVAGNATSYNRLLHDTEKKALAAEAQELRARLGEPRGDLSWEEVLLLAANAHVDAAESKRLEQLLGTYDSSNPRGASFKADLKAAQESIVRLAQQDIALTWADGKTIVAHNEEVKAFQATGKQYRDGDLFNKYPAHSRADNSWDGHVDVVPSAWKRQLGEKNAELYLRELRNVSSSPREFSDLVERVSAAENGLKNTSPELDVLLALSGAPAVLRALLAKRVSGASAEVGAKAITKVIAEFGPMNQGPLPKGIADTFRSGTYSEVVTQQPTTLYRVYGGTAQELGGYWTATEPAGPVQSIIDSALKPEWGNTATNVVKIEVPIGTKYFEGVAAPQGGLVGGGNQVLFPKDFKIDTSWIRQ